MRYIVESIGPVKDLPAKGNYGPSKIYTVKFKEDPNWSDVFRPADKPAPTIGEEMDGTIEKTQYGYSFKRTKTGFTPRAGGYSNRQIALQSAARMGLTSPDAVLLAAETFLAWLDASNATQGTEDLKTAENDLPPASNYDALGL